MMQPLHFIGRRYWIWTSDFYRVNMLKSFIIWRLTQKESEVLKILCKWKNQVVKRDDLLIAVWGNNDYFNGRSMDVFITKLRKYLQPDPQVAIENIPKIGFRLKDIWLLHHVKNLTAKKCTFLSLGCNFG